MSIESTISGEKDCEYIIHLDPVVPDLPEQPSISLDSLPWHKNHGRPPQDPLRAAKEHRKKLNDRWLSLEEK